MGNQYKLTLSNQTLYREVDLTVGSISESYDLILFF